MNTAFSLYFNWISISCWLITFYSYVSPNNLSPKMDNGHPTHDLEQAYFKLILKTRIIVQFVNDENWWQKYKSKMFVRWMDVFK